MRTLILAVVAATFLAPGALADDKKPEDKVETSAEVATETPAEARAETAPMEEPTTEAPAAEAEKSDETKPQ